jgi:hypothetical protein
MQNLFNITDPFSPLEQAELTHRLHYPSTSRYRTALVVPEWTEIMDELKRQVVADFPEVEHVPILSISVEDAFFESVEQYPGVKHQMFTGGVDTAFTDMYVHTMEIRDESIALLFNARDPVLANALQRWCALGFIPAVMRNDDDERMGFAFLDCLQELAAEFANAVAAPLPTIASRIGTLLEVLDTLPPQLMLPANATITVVAAPQNIAEVIGAIGDEFTPGKYVRSQP